MRDSKPAPRARSSLPGFPVALVAIPLAWIAVARIRTRLSVAAGALATILCATVGFPGVIDQGDLDARPVNALAGIGALVALGLTVWALRRGGRGDSQPLNRWDYARVVLAAVLVLAALPWIWAELGFYVDDTPVIGDPFIAKVVTPSLGGEPSLHAVHLGHHHGLDGILLAVAALLLSRVPSRMPRKAEGPGWRSTSRSSSRTGWRMRSRTGGTSSSSSAARSTPSFRASSGRI